MKTKFNSENSADKKKSYVMIRWVSFQGCKYGSIHGNQYGMQDTI
jgi:hypothetical protein